jgi:hypothetical protein
MKSLPNILTVEAEFATDHSNNVQYHNQIHKSLIDNQPITDLMIYIVSEINKFINTLYPGAFLSTISDLWTDYNNGGSAVTFLSLSLTQFIYMIVFRGHSPKLFNIKQDYPQLIALSNNQTTAIVFDVN